MKNRCSLFYYPAVFTCAWFIFSLSSFVSPAFSAPKSLFVDAGSGNNSNDCLTSDSACLTIATGGGAAVSKASSGDTIFIAAGTYAESIFIGTISLNLVGEDVSNTHIDATGKSTALLIYGGQTVSIRNLTFRNGSNYNLDINDMDTMLTANNIRVIDSLGTGIFANEGSIELKNVEISGNENQGLHLNPKVTTATVINTTISGNTDVGIGTASGPVLNITNSTITNNGKAGLALNNVTNIQNTIIAKNNTDNVMTTECYGSITSLGNNISGDNTGIGGTCSFDQPGDFANTDPLLGSLQFNGGDSKTHAPELTSSVAINGGSNIGCPADDQRGVPRPQGSICDIGAYEAETDGFNVIKAHNENIIVIPQ